MIFQFTLTQVLSLEKTQTRRIVKPNEVACRVQYNRIDTVRHDNRVKWRVGQTYSIQPGRGKPQVARLEITRIRSETVTRISTADAIAEGFSCRADFLSTWKTIHGEKSLDFRVWVIEFKVIAILMDTNVFERKGSQVAKLYAY